MSFEQNHQRVIQPKDTVIVYQTPMSITYVEVSEDPKAVFNCRFGTFKHSDMIGKSFGSKISSKKQGYVYLLYPTPELWTLVLSHRTQILYFADISYIITNLEIKPGSVVIEAGTGSGSFSHSVARAIFPNGKLNSFEYHEQRSIIAREEFKAHKLEDIVSVTHRDVCVDGFGLENVADAIFLDLPMPWLAIPFAKKAFKQSSSGRICCFSPCIEQVQKTAEALRSLDFIEIQTVEVLLKSYVSQYIQLGDPKNHTIDKDKSKKRKLDEDKKDSIIVAKPVKEMKGHTSYLTFATLLPPYREETFDPSTLSKKKDGEEEEEEIVEEEEEKMSGNEEE